MHKRERLKRAITHPKLFLRGLNRIYHQHRGSVKYNASGHNVFEEDWDNLIILDACRYDMFHDLSRLPGDLSPRESLGSATTEFLQAHIDGQDLTDTVYVTANPQLKFHQDDWDVRFHDVIQLWKGDGWDETYNTVLPVTVANRAIEAADKYPNKRLFIHFNQPHYPFLADIRFDSTRDTDLDENIWNRIFMGDLKVSRDEIWDAYKETLGKALPEVERLLYSLQGKTVVTADHGNFVGERASPIPIREWGHPRGIYCKPLTQVPWLEYTNGTRKRIITEQRVEVEDSIDDGTIESRLKDLGYKT